MYTFEQKRQFTLSIQEKKFNLGTLKEILYLHKKNFHWNVDVPHTLNWGVWFPLRPTGIGKSFEINAKKCNKTQKLGTPEIF